MPVIRQNPEIEKVISAAAKRVLPLPPMRSESTSFRYPSSATQARRANSTPRKITAIQRLMRSPGLSHLKIRLNKFLVPGFRFLVIKTRGRGKLGTRNQELETFLLIIAPASGRPQ